MAKHQKHKQRDVSSPEIPAEERAEEQPVELPADPQPAEEPTPLSDESAPRENAKNPHRLRRWLGWIGVVLAAILLVALVIDRYVIESTRARVVQVEHLSTEPVDAILVLGAGIREDGSLTPMLRDRMDVGISLYKAGLGRVLLLSGDGGSPDYDEPAAMRAYALSQGVPDAAIVMDKAGFSTRESLARAKYVGGYQTLTLVTQTYHLYRALYMAEGLELQAVGVSADLQEYRSRFSREMREILARNKDFFWGTTLPVGYRDPAGWISRAE